jgi:peptide/nickel transport system substrate-binding protein
MAGLVLALSSAHAAGKVLTGAFDVGPGGNAQLFNPLTASAGFSWYNKYFNTLVLYDVGFQNISGDLAQGWVISRDGKTVTFTMRKGVKWHDGTAFTSKDVKFTLDLVKNPDFGSPFATRLDSVVSVSTPDAQTVVLTLAAPNTPILDTLSSLMIVPQHLLGSMAPKDLRNSDWWRTKPVGTGAFKWNKYVSDQYVELDANPDFYRGRPKLDKLINRYFKDSGAAAIALQSGEIQFTYLTLDQVKQSQGSNAFKVVSGPSQVLNYIGFNNAEPRFKDVRVHQAMLMAIDRPAIIKSLYAGQAQQSNCVYSQKQYVPAGLDAYAYNPAKAKQLLAAAGWDKIKGEPLELVTYYGDQLSKDVVATIQSQLADVGVQVVPRFLDSAAFAKVVDSGKFTIAFAGGGNGPEPDTLAPLLESHFAPPKGVNRMRVAIPELDKLFDDGRKEINDLMRADIYKEICRVTNAQLPWAPLWVSNRFGGIGTKVQNMVWTPAPSGGRYQDNVETWTIQ